MTEPVFGHRGLKGPPIKGPPLGRPPESPPRRMRSNVVAVGAAGLLAAGLGGVTAYQQHLCQPPAQGEPDQRPQWCFGHSYSYSGGSHGAWGFISRDGGGWGDGGGAAHGRFGGFGDFGFGHGGGA